jgi:hypothetical protein
MTTRMPARPDRRSWRLALSAAALAYAGLAAGSALDRLAATSFAAEHATPVPLRVTAEAKAAERLIESGIPESALAPAQRLVARDPLGSGSAALLGAALLGQGQAGRADRAFRLAARRGWRDARTQLYWLRVALAQGEPKLAALRFGALARQWPQAVAVGQIATAFEATPEGRLALAERIAAGDRWASAYAQPGEAVPLAQLGGRAEVLLAAAGLGTQLGCAQIAPLVNRLIEGDGARAARLWQGHCPGAAAPGSLSDPDFNRASFAGPPVPFEWGFPGDGALQVDLVGTGSDGVALHVANRGAMKLAFAVQRVVASPGRYRLRILGEPVSGTLLASLSCRREFSQALPQTVAGGNGVLAFTGGCAAPWLQLWLSAGGTAKLDAVGLERL